MGVLRKGMGAGATLTQALSRAREREKDSVNRSSARCPIPEHHGTGSARPSMWPPARGWARHAVRNLGVCYFLLT